MLFAFTVHNLRSLTPLNPPFLVSAYFMCVLCRFALSSMDMEQRDYDSRTALHVAAAEGSELIYSNSSFSTPRDFDLLFVTDLIFSPCCVEIMLMCTSVAFRSCWGCAFSSRSLQGEPGPQGQVRISLTMQIFAFC